MGPLPESIKPSAARGAAQIAKVICDSPVAQYEGALEQLEQFGLLSATGPKREVFRITATGYDFADSYTKG